MSAVIFDLIAVLLIVIMIIVSAKKGFISGLLSFAGWLISALIAKIFSGVVANFVYSSLAKKQIYDAVFSVLEERNASLSSSYSDFFESLPQVIRDLLGSADPDALNSILSNPDHSLETVATQISEDVVGPVVMTILTALSFIVIFLISMLLVKVFVKVFKNVKKIPVIGPINTFLGGVAGAIEAVIIIYIITLVIEFVTTAAGGNLFGLSLDDFSNSIIFKILGFRG